MAKFNLGTVTEIFPFKLHDVQVYDWPQCFLNSHTAQL